MFGCIMSWDFTTIGETDFYTNGYTDSATHVLIINENDASNIPSFLITVLDEQMDKVGYVTSKHALTQPHRVLDDECPMWPILRHGNTLFVVINSPPTVSSQLGAQRNEWLFNYPPARDIAMFFKDYEHLGVLTTFALNRLFNDKRAQDLGDSCVRIDANDLGTEDVPHTLQPIWAWLSPQIHALLSEEGESSIFIMPSEETNNEKGGIEVKPALFDEMVKLLREHGFDLPEGVAKEAQDTYIGMSSEAMMRIQELMSQVEFDDGNKSVGGMYQ